MGVVKKTVAIHPVMDSGIRRIWSMLIEKGYDATYSTALNFLILAGLIGEKDIASNPDYLETLNSFLKDERSITELEVEDLFSSLEARIAKRARK